MSFAQTQPIQDRAELLYEQYGKPLEKTHFGKYIAISPNGKTLIGNTLIEIIQRAKTALDPGNFIFKIGDRAVGK
jgi:hypothetical protein